MRFGIITGWCSSNEDQGHRPFLDETLEWACVSFTAIGVTLGFWWMLRRCYLYLPSLCCCCSCCGCGENSTPKFCCPLRDDGKAQRKSQSMFQPSQNILLAPFPHEVRSTLSMGIEGSTVEREVGVPTFRFAFT
mmetsp:Transcript_30104/g.48314  ORF Transcript_30104/g.48314 Transcript_30104/m.48314 type:complete len:134 (-) Transcript_30104:243-644(-)